MSLLNDALRRAKESQPQSPPTVPPPLPTVKMSSRSGNGWILILAVILFLAAICLCIAAVAEYKAIPIPTDVPTPIAVAPATVETQKSAITPPPVATPKNPSKKLPRVQGIFFDAAHPAAIVDNKTVKVGDRIGAYLIKTISRNSVTFQNGDGSLKEIKIGE